MIKIAKVSVVVVVGLGLSMVHANSMKKYEVKSGKIEYALSGGGNIMGIAQTKSVGKKRVIFDNYGVENIEEQVEVKKTTTAGKTETDKTHTLRYTNNAVIYSVNFKKKHIERMKNHGAEMAAMFGGGDNLKESGEAMMKKMGGKKIGTDKVLGYTCDVWELMGSKQCIYKGIPLSVETDVMGLKSTEVATKAEFDLALTKNDFKLPDYPVYDMNMDRIMNGKEPKILDKSTLEEMDRKDNTQAKVDAKEGAEVMKGMAAGMAALVKAGVDLNADELTPEQEKIMQSAMMTAMGGEGKIVAKMKKEMLENIEQLDFAQKCFGDADTLSDANGCVDKGNKMFDDDEEHMTSWTKVEKDEMLNNIAEFEKNIPCIKAAKTMNAMRQCMPENK
jgi:hypothetical protein